jgi:hypothetical protein
MPQSGPPEVVDEDGLYDVAPEQFIAARDDLVKRLRSRGDKSGAARVAKWRRPPLTVWVLNQVTRARPEVIEALLGAGRELRAAMERALDGDASGLRQARDDERAAVGAVVAAAERRLSDGGYTPTDVIRQRLAATLRAAIVDESVADRLRRGSLDQDHDVPGFGMDALSAPLTVVRSPDRPQPQPEQPPPEQPQPEPSVGGRRGADDTDDTDDIGRSEATQNARRRQEAQQEADRLEAEATGLAAEAERLADEVGRLTAEAKRLAGEAERLAAEAERMATAAGEADRRAAAARGSADQARRAAVAGRAEADRLAAS